MNFDVLKQAADWLMEKVLPKATILTGIFMAVGALTYTAAVALKLRMPAETHPILTEVGKYGALFWGFLAVTTLISEMRKSTKLRVAIHAEQIRMNPDVPDTSAIPQVQTEITKQIIEGNGGKT